MDIIVYLCGMNFTSQVRYNPKTGRDERYYRLKESYRNALGRSCTRILLNVGFVDDLLPEEMRDISRALTYKYEHQDDKELWPDALCVYSDRVRARALEYWGEMVKLGSLDIISKAYEASKAKAERHVDTETLEHKDARDIGAEWLCLQAIRQLEFDKFLLSLGFHQFLLFPLSGAHAGLYNVDYIVAEFFALVDKVDIDGTLGVGV